MLRKVFGSHLTLGDWAFRALIGVVFIFIGLSKFNGGEWVQIFARIGWGQWFRYFTAIVQTSGGVLLLVPLTARVGMAMLAATMAGAAFFDVFFLGYGPIGVLIPGFLLGLILAAGWKGRGEPETGDPVLSLRQALR